MSEISFVDYPVPLRGGTVIARLRLPLDFCPSDVPHVRGVLYAIADAWGGTEKGPTYGPTS